jgi:hypothetical protein
MVYGTRVNIDHLPACPHDFVLLRKTAGEFTPIVLSPCPPVFYKNTVGQEGGQWGALPFLDFNFSIKTASVACVTGRANLSDFNQEGVLVTIVIYPLDKLKAS